MEIYGFYYVEFSQSICDKGPLHIFWAVKKGHVQTDTDREAAPNVGRYNKHQKLGSNKPGNQWP